MKNFLIIISCIVVSLFTFSCRDKSVESPTSSQVTQIEYKWSSMLGSQICIGRKDSFHFIETFKVFDPPPIRDSLHIDTSVYYKNYLDSLLSLFDVQEAWNLNDNSNYPDSKLTITALVPASNPTLPDEEKIKVIKFEDTPSAIKLLIQKLNNSSKPLLKR
ncbi:MAG: hypothetical protein JST20_10780 [Bacteroidetes bacterium]|nr:hypothetical protein [Bacteroidota bacterium]